MSSRPESVTGSRCKRGFLFFGGSYSGTELIEELKEISKTYEAVLEETPMELESHTARIGMAMDDGDPMAYARSEYEVEKLRRMGYGPVSADFSLEGEIDGTTVFDVEISYDPASECLESEATFYDPRADRWQDDLLIDQLF